MLFRPAMGRDVEAANLWGNARAIWSQWDGYLKEGPGAKVKADLATRGIPLEVIHTSGHASIADLKLFSERLQPSRLIPIHTFEGDSFSKYFKMSRDAAMANGGRFRMSFKRGIRGGPFREALETLAHQDGWWKDVLADKSLIIGIRDEYVNVYWQGQSIFKVSFKGSKVTASTHEKYLLNPDLEDQIPLIDGKIRLRKSRGEDADT